MAKTRTTLTVPEIDAWLTVACHFGPMGTWDPTSVHAIYYYQALDLPPDVTAYHYHDTEDSAILEARAWLVLPQLVKDICSLCRSMAAGPNIPRWNIYRGQDQSPVPPNQWWDAWLGPPPWPSA
jgi:hypothetical protein